MPASVLVNLYHRGAAYFTAGDDARMRRGAEHEILFTLREQSNLFEIWRSRGYPISDLHLIEETTS